MAIPHLHRKKSDSEDKKRILTKAFFRMVDKLNLSRQELSVIVGLSEPSLSRLFSNPDPSLNPESNEGQLVILMLRLYRSLDMLFGGNEKQYQLWLRSNNKHLNGKPIELIQSIEGLVLTVQYLDAIRGKN